MRLDRILKSAPWWLAALCPPTLAGEAPLELQGAAAYHGLRIPLAVQAQTRWADLSDIQVLNARGEPVPHAWADETGEASAQQRQQAVPFFKAPAAASAADAAQQGGWILDLRAVKAALLSLDLDVPASAQGVYGFVLERSDNLQQWQTVQTSAQLLSLQHQGLRLEHSHFELGGLRARYLRLRPLPGSQPPPLTGARVTSVTHYRPAPAVQWSDVIAPARCTAQYCDYTLPRHLPLERLQWQLAEADTLAPVELRVQYDFSEADAPSPGPRRRRHRVRDHFKGLRQKTAPTPAEASAVWHPLTSTTAYWLRLPEGEVRSPDLALGGALVKQLRVQPAGGMVQLGAKPPTLRVGAQAASLVFLAREPAPYRLAWGGEAGKPLTLAQLMPTRRPGDPLPADTAAVVLPPPAPAPVAAVPPASAAASAAPAAPVPSRKFWLWGVLLAALALMGLMAWSLLRPAAKTEALP